MLIIAPLIWLALTFALLARGVDPVPVIFYLLAWYPTLVLLEALARRAGARPVGRSALFSVWLWSAPIWLVFEAANLRLENWYYVFVPRVSWQRWTGVCLAFATVLPALFLAERLFDSLGVGKRWRARTFEVSLRGLNLILALGVLMLVLSLAWPQVFFPYIWGALWLICEPYVYRRRRDLSLFGDLERGEWGRIGRLAISGAVIGLIWETFNFWARAKWIYTVPGLENLKLYEMPLVGFIGFPFFALEAWAMYHALCAAGVALPLGERTLRQPRRLAAVVAIAAFSSGATMWGIDRHTVSSVAPYLEDLPGITPAEVSTLRYGGVKTIFQLAAMDGLTIATDLHWPTLRGDSLAQLARLATLRGIGVPHARSLQAIGIADVCPLAVSDPERTWRQLQELTREHAARPTLAETAVWQRAALPACMQQLSH